jgi:outer membrane biosynthesis protein TonB
MDRAEKAGFGIAVAGHLALLAALSLGVAATRLPPPKQQPIEVSFVDAAAAQSQAPEASAEAPAQKLAEEAGPPEPAAPPPLPQATPQVQPAPAPPRPAPAPGPRPAPPRPAPPAAAPSAPAAPPVARPAPRSTGRLSGLLAGLSDSDSPSRSTKPPAATAGPAVEASLAAEVRRQVKPQWQKVVPTGADAESLRTELSLTLARDGSVLRADVVGTTGITASNRPQVALHQERAKKAVMLASPFHLPADYYDAWKQINVTLDLRLSQ